MRNTSDCCKVFPDRDGRRGEAMVECELDLRIASVFEV